MDDFFIRDHMLRWVRVGPALSVLSSIVDRTLGVHFIQLYDVVVGYFLFWSSVLLLTMDN